MTLGVHYTQLNLCHADPKMQTIITFIFILQQHTPHTFTPVIAATIL